MLFATVPFLSIHRETVNIIVLHSLKVASYIIVLHSLKVANLHVNEQYEGSFVCFFFSILCLSCCDT